MKGGWRMEFINIQNKEGVTIINDTYDNLVYLSFPKQKDAVLYTGGNEGDNANGSNPAQACSLHAYAGTYK